MLYKWSLPKTVVMCLAAGLASAVACGHSSEPTSPARAASADTGLVGTLSSLTATSTATLSDPVTLKVLAPVAQSPINDTKVENAPVLLVASAAAGKFATPSGLQYRFLVFGPTGALAEDSGLQPAPTFAVTTNLDFEKRHTWVVRAELAGAVGPWSTQASFLAPAGGYIIGNEVYDPLINGKTVGEIHGPVTFIPGVGVRLDAEESYIQYALPQTLTQGSMSVLATGMGVTSSSEDPKLRIFTMREGDAAINDNEYRMSVDKRGNGAIAWRFLTGPGSYIQTQGGERQVYPFHERLTYFVQATWRDGFFNVTFRENGVNGTTIYDFGKPYERQYTPFPHRVFLGSPYSGGDRGEPSSLDGMVIRQVWVSSRPRPAAANQ